jgi:hypothetical protein
MTMEASEEDFAEKQQAKGLPERNRVPPKDWRNENIPQAFYDKAEHKDSSGDKECDSYCFDCSVHNSNSYFFSKSS